MPSVHFWSAFEDRCIYKNWFVALPLFGALFPDTGNFDRGFARKKRNKDLAS